MYAISNLFSVEVTLNTTQPIYTLGKYYTKKPYRYRKIKNAAISTNSYILIL